LPYKPATRLPHHVPIMTNDPLGSACAISLSRHQNNLSILHPYIYRNCTEGKKKILHVKKVRNNKRQH